SAAFNRAFSARSRSSSFLRADSDGSCIALPQPDGLSAVGGKICRAITLALRCRILATGGLKSAWRRSAASYFDGCLWILLLALSCGDSRAKVGLCLWAAPSRPQGLRQPQAEYG